MTMKSNHFVSRDPIPLTPVRESKMWLPLVHSHRVPLGASEASGGAGGGGSGRPAAPKSMPLLAAPPEHSGLLTFLFLWGIFPGMLKELSSPQIGI